MEMKRKVYGGAVSRKRVVLGEGILTMRKWLVLMLQRATSSLNYIQMQLHNAKNLI